MTKSYHINSYGVVGICEAINGNCPFGGSSGIDFHFEQKQEAIKYAEINSEIYAMANSEPSTETEMRANNFPNNGYGKLALYLKQVKQEFSNIKNKQKQMWIANNKKGNIDDYMTPSLRRKEKKANRRYNLLTKQIRRIESQRQYAESFKSKLPENSIVYESTSDKSSSKYIYIKSSFYNDVCNILKEEGLDFKQRDNAKEHLGDYFVLRFSDHYPPAYQVDKENYWLNDSNPTFLASYPKVKPERFRAKTEEEKIDKMIGYLEQRGKKKFWE
jgi:hypothetical protein